MSDRKSFGILLFELSQKLSDEEITAIVHIENLSPKLKEKQNLEVLIRLQMDGKISETDPASLQAVFKNINRMDLVSRVKDYIKSQKKKEKKAQKSRTLCHQMDKMVSDLEANLKVTLLQAQVLKEQLLNVVNAAAKCEEEKLAKRIQQSIESLQNDIEKPIVSALDPETSKDSCSSIGSVSEDSSPDSTFNRHLFPSKLMTQQLTKELSQIACYPTQEETRESDDEGVYEIISNTPHTPYVPFVSTPDEDHYCPMADLQPEQITATLVEALPGTTLRRSSNAVVPTDKPSLKNLKKNLDRPMPPPKPSKFRSEPTDDDKDGSMDDCSFTGSGSDSGFCESWNLVRPIALPRHPPSHQASNSTSITKLRPVPRPRRTSGDRPPPSTDGYMQLNTERVQSSYYKSSARDFNKKYHDILSGESSETDTVKEEDHSIYENVSKK